MNKLLRACVLVPILACGNDGSSGTDASSPLDASDGSNEASDVSVVDQHGPPPGPAIYIAQTSAGNDTGVDCANAHGADWFNAATNWGSETGQIGPGVTAHLCGVFTSAAQGGHGLTVQASGAQGNVITLYFEPNARFDSTGWWGADGLGECSSGCWGAIPSTKKTTSQSTAARTASSKISAPAPPAQPARVARARCNPARREALACT